MRPLLSLALLTVASSAFAQGVTKECTPIETRAPNATGQTPAFAGQYRACAAPSNVAYDVTVVARRIEKPWSIEPLPDGAWLVTEKNGRLRVIGTDGKIAPPIAGMVAVDSRGQGGLLDVALSPSFATDNTIFWTFTEPRGDGNGTAIARGTLSADRRRVDNVKVIFRVLPTYDGIQHFGSRIAFGPDGMLYAVFGERSDTPMRRFAQQLDSHLGKVIRIAPDGSVPKDNPFVGRQGAQPEIWSLGHRNIQALTFDPQGRLWEIEHGTRGGDEVNLVEKGKNYGWPLVAYGIEYSGQPIQNQGTAGAGFEQPVYFWDPNIAPSGAQVYTGNAFPAWKGSLFVGGLAGMKLVRLAIANNKVVGEEHLLADRNQRIRDVKQGNDGALYVVTDADNGELWKISPKP